MALLYDAKLFLFFSSMLNTDTDEVLLMLGKMRAPFFETSGHIAEVFSELLHKPDVRLAKKQVTIKTIFGAVLFFSDLLTDGD